MNLEEDGWRGEGEVKRREDNYPWYVTIPLSSVYRYVYTALCVYIYTTIPLLPTQQHTNIYIYLSIYLSVYLHTNTSLVLLQETKKKQERKERKSRKRNEAKKKKKKEILSWSSSRLPIWELLSQRRNFLPTHPSFAHKTRKLQSGKDRNPRVGQYFQIS